MIGATENDAATRAASTSVSTRVPTTDNTNGNGGTR